MRKVLSLLPAAALLLAHGAAARADVTSDRAAAILIFPRVIAQVIDFDADDFIEHRFTDTIVQISNTSTEPVTMQCFYVNANGRCSVSDTACTQPGGELDLGCPLAVDLCLPGWTETDFQVILTPRQPIAWRASRGLAREQFPLDGVAFQGPRGESNAGSAVPPVTLEEADPGFGQSTLSRSVFEGELKCIAVDASGRAIDRNVLKGEATVVASSSIREDDGVSNYSEVERYNAVGIQAITGDANGDGILELGGETAEYNPCPSVLIASHFFDDRLLGNRRQAALTLVPCGQDLRAQIPGSTTAQFLVFNEFEQRFSTSAPVSCYFNRRLSSIDTADPRRSIFSTAVAGTTSGQTRIRGVSGGLLGVLTQTEPPSAPGEFGSQASANLHFAGERQSPDLVVIP